MNALIFLIVFPLAVSFLALVPPLSLTVRKVVGVCVNIVLCAVPIYLLVTYLDSPPVYFSIESRLIDSGMLLAELFIALFIVYVSVRAKRYLPVLLVVVQSLIMVIFEFTSAHGMQIEHSLFVDKFSIIMALIVGIIGSAICLYAIGYMPEYHEHYREVKDRRRYFAFLMYLFLSAMFGIVFSNNLMWLYFFWEITTVCSFLLIGYRDDERFPHERLQGAEHEPDRGGRVRRRTCLPLFLLRHHGTGQAAPAGQGAGSAPRRLSRLCRAGEIGAISVFLMAHRSHGGPDAGVGPAPFEHHGQGRRLPHPAGGAGHAGLCRCEDAHPHRRGKLPHHRPDRHLPDNAKKVLAYSTISNLGLIVACAGVNTEAAVWSAILLIIFHAVAKSLLFLCVGIVEYKLGSRDIEDMDYLIMRLPKLTALMMTGMAGMFLAPFGMIISKFITLKAFVESNPAMAIILAYGSAATIFFWTKWMGKIMSIKHGVAEVMEHRVSRWEWITLGILAVATVAVCLGFPFISFHVINPYLRDMFGTTPVIDTFNMLIVFVIMLGLLIILPLGLLYYAFVDKNYKRVGTYLGGGNIDNTTFEGAMASTQTIELKNYYLEKYFGEERLFNVGVFVSVTLMFIMFGVAVI